LLYLTATLNSERFSAKHYAVYRDPARDILADEWPNCWLVVYRKTGEIVDQATSYSSAVYIAIQLDELHSQFMG